jgi:hypothetical protein
MANTHHANSLALHDAANALYLMAQIAGTKRWWRRALVCEAELVDESVDRSLLRGRTRGYVSIPGILSVAVYLVLDFFGCAAVCFAAADYTTITLANTSAKTAEDFAVLISPTPDTLVVMICGPDTSPTRLAEPDTIVGALTDLPWY